MGCLVPHLFLGILRPAAPSEWGSSLAAATSPGCEGAGSDIMKNVGELQSQGRPGSISGAHVHFFPDNDPKQGLELLSLILGPHEAPSLLPECQKTPFWPRPLCPLPWGPSQVTQGFFMA